MAIVQKQTEARVLDLVKDTVFDLGYDIVRIKIFQGGKRKNLQIMIEKVGGASVTVKDCEKVSIQVSIMLDVADIIPGEYNLEVSSPGVDRPLTRFHDFENCKGKSIKFTLNSPLNGKRRFIGVLEEINDQTFTFKLKDMDEQLQIKYEDIEEAFLQYFDSNIQSNRKSKRV